MEEHRDYVQSETLAIARHREAPPGDATVSQETVAGEAVTLGVRRTATGGT